MVITGAAPTSPSVLSFLRAALGCQVRTPINDHTYMHKKQNVHLQMNVHFLRFFFELFTECLYIHVLSIHACL